MSGLERAVEWLRHFVDTNVFDYCVVWKLGDDPSRFIEWMDCCCCGGGGGYGHVNVKEETGVENQISSICRDVNIRHLRRTKACEALACFPSSIALYSGIHGEVVILNQPRWISSANGLDSTPSDELMGTRVLIPVIGGLIELYSGKHIPEDQKITEFVIAQCNFYSEQEAITIHSYTDLTANEKSNVDPFLSEHLHNQQPPFPCSSLAKMQFLHPATQFGTHRSLEGSSTGSTPSNENSSLESASAQLFIPPSSNQLIGKNLGSENPKYSKKLPKQKMDSSSVCGKRVVEIDNVKVIKRSDGENYQSKNLEMERNRRIRIRDGLYQLRALVPKISKMDRASILGDAIEHIRELQKQVKELQDELKDMDDDCNKSNAEIRGVILGSPMAGHNHGSSEVNEMKQMKVQVEVNHVGTRGFLLKFIYEHKRGGFVRLMEAMTSLGLQVVDANVTTFDGKVLNIFKVQANKEIQLKKLKDSLIKLTG